MPILSDIKKIFLTGTAIYITDDFVDIAVAGPAVGGLKISSLKRFPLFKNIKGLSYAEAKEELDRIFEKAFPEEAPKPYRVAVNIRNENFILRHFMLRSIPKNELRQAIIFEAQKYVPYSMDDLSYGFKVCDKRGDSEHIVFAASEMKNITGIIEYFKNKNMLASVIEPVPALAARALSLERKLDKSSAYISLHYEPTNKVIITGMCYRNPQFFKEIQLFPGEEEFKTAELNYPSLKDIWTIIENDVLGGVEYLRRETKKNVETIFVSGFSFSSDDEHLAREFGMRFERANLNFAKNSDSETRDRFLPTIALLYDSMHTPFINLAPEETVHEDLWVFRPIAIRAALGFL